MAQEKFMINGLVIHQPDKDVGYSFETTYSEDSGRVYSGVANVSPLFTIERLSLSFTGISIKDGATLLQNVLPGYPFTAHYFSPYHGIWRDAKFYVGEGDLDIGTLKEKQEQYSHISFNMVSVEPVKGVRQ